MSDALALFGIRNDIHEGHGLALVSVWVGLVIWTDGRCYRWWSGRTSPRTGRWVYAFGPVDDPMATGRRVALRYDDIRRTPSWSGLIPDGWS